LLAIPSYGLANRLRTLGSAKVMADALGKDLRLLWEVRGDIPRTRWLDLFEPSPDIVELPTSRLRYWFWYKPWSLPLAGANRLHVLGGLPYDRRAAHELLHTFTTHENTPFACAHRRQTKPCSIHAECSVRVDPRWKHVSLRGQFNYKLVDMSDAEYMRRMRAFYRSLRPTAAVDALVGALTPEFAPDTIGVHFRQTDNDRSFYEGLIPNASYFTLVDRAIDERPSARLFIAADTRAAREAARQRYGDRVLTHPTDAPDADPELSNRYSTLGQQAALADMIALSRTAFIVGTRFSSFTYVAAALGDVPFVEAGTELTPDPLT
jgi:hypothetical protein